ncbi:MAG TPA: prolyl oligopeptidase family serine peptidase [Verrucomicrobiae bacterium]|nr:prolyl oligopeptidase family serine peptidase [Verrucomicrobiae bacterium]
MRCIFLRCSLLAFGMLSFSSGLRSQTSLNYQEPPKAIVELVDTRPTPMVDVSPKDRDGTQWLLMEEISGLPPISELAEPELRMAGLRFNPRTNGPSRGRYITALRVKALPDGDEKTISGVPANPKIRFASWSPDARHVAFVHVTNDGPNAGLGLWIADVETAKAKQIPGVALNATFGQPPCEWMGDSEALICKAIVKTRGPAPQRSEVPTGPVVQENLGRVTPGPTYEDLLKSPEDERIFDYYATTQVEEVRLDGKIKPIGKAGVIESASPSPDGHYVLIEERHHPYSYLLPFEFFPERVEIVNLSNGATKQLIDKPLEDTIPNIHDAVESGPREFDWRSDAPATVFWAEAQDGGDPRRDAPLRDALYMLDAPFDGMPHQLAELPVRFRSMTWGTGKLALVEERRWKDRKRIMLAVSPDHPRNAVKLFEGSFEDRYNDPGRPLEVMNARGKLVLKTTEDESGIYLHARGASPEGDRPFLAVMNASTGESQRVWQCEDKFYEAASAVLGGSHAQVLIRKESPELPPNYYLAEIGKDDWKQVTFFPNPYGRAVLPKKQVLQYKRADGVNLSANLYLPPGYKPTDGPLPTLMEAYPTEYKTKSAAGQIAGSPYEFPLLYWGSPIPFVTQGYAVLENATIPIIGEGKAEPNDTYVEQLVASAQAAIDEGASLGVVDRNRVAVMGHSYGAFMTANLLAHSDLFKAGIARSGAYNRTLTPFGFQNEDRTYWQAPEVYYKMSPFSYADKIKTPLLLIHGEEDNNTGTFPIQSERLFSAIKGQGGTVRFVLLPLESHGYAGRESVLHMFWEMNNWMEKYVKNAAPATASATQ